MQAGNLTSVNQQNMSSVSTNDTKQLPSWMQKRSSIQQKTSEGAQKQEAEQKDVPRWLQEKLEKTEQDVKQAAAERASQEVEAQRKQMPRWMQDQGVRSKAAESSQAPQKSLPKWLQDKPPTSGNQSDNQKMVGQVPKWLQAKTSASQESTVSTSTGKYSSQY